jgi:outer membrane murein-binding lipoprotein Lpp
MWVPDPSRSSKPFIIGGIIAAAVAVIVAVVLVITLSGGSEQSDEDQIRSVVSTFQDAYNRSDVDALREISCKKMQTAFDDFKARSQNAVLTVKSVTINGDTAVAAVVEDWGDGSKPRDDTYNLIREDGRWKACV